MQVGVKALLVANVDPAHVFNEKRMAELAWSGQELLETIPTPPIQASPTHDLESCVSDVPQECKVASCDDRLSPDHLPPVS